MIDFTTHNSTSRVRVAFNVVVAGFIYSHEKVLLAQRSHNLETAPGLWHLPGGHLEAQETTAEALKREIYEELQMDVQVGLAYDTFCYESEDTHTLGVIHFAKPLSPTGLLPNECEIVKTQWATAHEATDLLAPNRDHNLRLCIKGFELIMGALPLSLFPNR